MKQEHRLGIITSGDDLPQTASAEGIRQKLIGTLLVAQTAWARIAFPLFLKRRHVGDVVYHVKSLEMLWRMCSPVYIVTRSP